MFSKNNTLILGFGSNILTDAGIGVHLTNDLQKSELFSNVDFETALISSLEILEIIDGYKTLIIIDGIKSEDNQVGNIKISSLADFQPTIHISNIHDFEFKHIIELGGLLGLKMPDDIYIISIEVQDHITFSENLSDELKSKYNLIRNIIIHQIKDIMEAQSLVIF